MTINFEADQQDAMKKTENIQSLADQVSRLEGLSSEMEDLEGRLKIRYNYSLLFIISTIIGTFDI